MRVTNNYNLPQFLPNDVFNLADFNEAFNTIDNAMNDLQETFNINGTVADLTTFEVVQARQGENNLLTNIQKTKDTLNLIVSGAEVNVKNFGAKGDGITDDTLAIQNAINSIETGIISFGGSDNIYKITSTIRLKSNITLDFKNSTLLVPNVGYCFSAYGTLENDINITQDIGEFDKSVNVSSVVGLNESDYVLIKGQRDALNSTDSKNLLLGCATENIGKCYFGEYKRIKSITNNTLNFDNTMFFSDYFKDKTRETSLNARECTTVTKVNFITNCHIKNVNILGKSSGVFVFENCKDCSISNAKMKAYGDGVFIIFRRSLNCTAYQSSWIGDDTSYIDHYTRNVFKIISSTNCSFDNCYCERGSQCFDITFENEGVASVDCKVSNCTTNFSTYNSMISHGGTYGTIFINNTCINNSRAGISTRSLRTLIQGNIVEGSREGYGICLYEKGAKYCQIKDNYIKGFYYAISVEDNTQIVDSCFDYIGLDVTGNNISDCQRAFGYNKSVDNTYNGYVGICFEDNNINIFQNKTYQKTININPTVKGVIINNNRFHGSPTSNALIYCEAESDKIVITNNKFFYPKATCNCIWFANPTTVKNMLVKDNIFYGDSVSKVVKPTNITIDEINFGLI